MEPGVIIARYLPHKAGFLGPRETGPQGREMKSKEGKPGLPMRSEATRSTGGSSGALDKETQTKIGQQLRAMYDDVVRQGVPDRFSDLLKRLERGEGAERAEDEESKP